MKRFAATLAFIAAFAAAQAEQPFAQDRVGWNKPAAPFHIIGNVYYVGTADLSVHLIKTPKGLILIDEGLPESVPLIEQNITSLGFKLKDVKLLIAGHAHFDHVGGLAALKKATGAQVVAMAQDAPIIEAGRISFGPSNVIPFDAVKVDRIVHDGETVELGGTVLTAHRTPGHTPGCTTWTMPVIDAGTTHEVAFAGSITVGGNPLIGNSAYPNIATDYRASFAILKRLKSDVVLTEHQSIADEIGKAARAKPGASNPFVDAGELTRIVDVFERDFDKQIALQQAAAKH